MSTEILALMTQTGKLKKDAKLPRLSNDQLRDMYRQMVLTRVLDERGMNLQRQGRVGFYVPSRGEEALQIGAAAALQKDDWVFASYRIPGLALARGASPETMMNQIYGNAADVCHGHQMPCHYSLRPQNFVSISSPIGTRIPQAAGAAMAMKYKKAKSVSVVFFGDGGTSSDGFHLGMNFGAVFDAPVIFFCQNNGWAISVPLEKQTKAESIAIKAEAYGMPGVRVDGNDVLAVYQVMSEAVKRARDGKGPTLIEAVTFRMGPHSSSDDPTRYRSKELVESWEKKDPIARFQKYLKGKKLWDEDFEEECQTKARDAIGAAIAAAEKAGTPPVETMFEGVYEKMTPELELQQEGLRRLEETGQLTGKDEGFFPL